jgi:hypothetical protein
MTRRSNMSKFEELYNLNVNGKTEQKNGLTYLSWAWAWAEFKKVYPDATYEVVKFDGLPYACDDDTGYMVYTKVTADGITHEMWLPVMDGANHAMKSERYEIQTKYKKITVEAATMFDVNKTIMRCLTKNLAMFGLGLYIYAGEDLPETETPEAKAPEPIKCPKCGKVITPIKKQDGSVAQPADILKGCGGMCYDCYQKKA